MASSRIHFFSEDTPFLVKKKEVLRNWVSGVIRNEDGRPGDINFIFCSDAYLLSMNREYLDHDTYTDIITFDNSSKEKEIAGDIFISIDRVRENSKLLNTNETDELHRVMIHGILHLIGFKDKTKADKELMRSKEDFYILRK